MWRLCCTFLSFFLFVGGDGVGVGGSGSGLGVEDGGSCGVCVGVFYIPVDFVVCTGSKTLLIHRFYLPAQNTVCTTA